MLRKHSITFVLVMIFHVQILSAAFARKVYFSRCLSSKPFLPLDTMSLLDCVTACAKREHCLAVGYHKISQICRLHDTLTSLSPCAGYYAVLKSDFSLEGTGICSGPCPKTDCHHIPSINNAETFGNLLRIGDVVKVKCNDDDSISSIECQTNGVWSQLPTCSAAVTSCGTPENVANADVTYSSTSVNSTASYTCRSNYWSVPSGASTSITCLAAGQWESIGFTCQQVDCGLPQNISNAQRTFTSTTVGFTASYTCIPSYVVSPAGTSMSITCQASGDWESISFTCIAQQVDCGAPQNVANAQRTFTSTTVGSTASYTCDSNYTISPSNAASSITCLDTGQWESIGFTCQQIDCGAPQNVANAQRTFTSTTVGSTALYTCVSNYTISPSNAATSFTCLDTGQWESIGFTCQQIDCGAPQNVSNAQRTFTSTIVGSTASYTCDSNYTISPSNAATSFTCLDTGQWESIGFTCQQIDCGAPQNVANAQRTFTSTIVGSTASYTCDSNYTISPSNAASSITCLDTGQWESIGFTCQQIDCGAPQNVANAQRTFTSTTVGSAASYTCDSNYTISPSNAATSITCLDTGQWESIGFTCQQIDCGAPQNVANAQRTFTSTTVGSTALYTCDSNYTISPSNAATSFTCLDTGQWESIGFTCQQIDCGAPQNVSNAQRSFTSTTVGSTASYTCSPSHVGSPTSVSMSITCQSSGDWESISFTCIASVPVGTSCTEDSDCIDPASRCLYTGLWYKGSRCYCKPLYEFNQSQSVCTKACDSYTSFATYTGEYIRKHNVGDSDGDVLTEAECLQFCYDNFGDSYLSVDHRHAYTSGTNCYCGSVTRQQAVDASPDLLYTDSEYNMFTKTCD